MKKYCKFANKISALFGFIGVVFGVLVCSPEYNGTNNKPGLKDYLAKEINIDFSLSLFLFILISTLILLAVIHLLKYIFMNIIRKDEELLSEKKLLTDKISECNKKINETETTINNLNKEVEIRERKLNNYIERLLVKDKRAQIIKVIEDFVANYDDIIAIQLYECKKEKASGYISYEIVQTPYSYTRSGKVANLINEKYRIREELLIEYNQAIYALKIGNSKALLEYIKKMNQKMQRYAKYNRVTENIYNMFILLSLALQNYLGEVGFKIDNIDENFINNINQYKRSGIIKGLIHRNYYKFYHKHIGHKEERVYVTKCLPIENRSHLFVIILEPEKNKTKAYGDYLDHMGENFHKLLSTKTDLVYNDIKEGDTYE